jgi:transposase-like protein
MKARIALEALKEQKTVQEIASHYGVHPSQVTNWKRQAIQGAPELFADRRSQPDTSEEALKAESNKPVVCNHQPTSGARSTRFKGRTISGHAPLVFRVSGQNRNSLDRI